MENVRIRFTKKDFDVLKQIVESMAYEERCSVFETDFFGAVIAAKVTKKPVVIRFEFVGKKKRKKTKKST